MKYIKVTKIEDISVGDKILCYSDINDKFFNFTVRYKITLNDGTCEIVVNKKRNYYFNLSAVLNPKIELWGKWVDEVWIKKS